MVVANSSWVRPAQALVYSDSGEVQYFPPRNRGRLPRALTFGDHHDYRQLANDQQNAHNAELEAQLMSFQYSEQLQAQEQDSFWISAESDNLHIEDPPDEYTSFESEYSKNSILQEADINSVSYMDLEAPTMSTPTEQYINNVLKRKKLSPRSPSSKQQPYLSSVSDTPNGCMSPLLQPDSEKYFSLDELVDLYARKLESARSARASKEAHLISAPERTNSADVYEEEKLSNINAMDSESDLGVPQHEYNRVMKKVENLHCDSHDKNAINACSSLQLMAFDIQLFLQKLDAISSGNDRKTHYQDWLYISIEELELILMNCCKESIQFVME